MSITNEEYLICEKDVVLDVGGGHNPFWRADIIIDLFSEDNTQRGGA